MMRLLLAAVSTLALTGCSMLRSPTVLPIDVVVRPRLEAKIDVPQAEPLVTEPRMLAVIGAVVVLLALAALFRPRKRTS